MARQVLPWVGAAVGMWAGGNWQLGFAIGSALGNAVDPQVIKGPQLGEGTNSTASEGGYRPIVFGKGRVGTCIIHQGPLIKRTIRTRQSKGGGPVTEEQRAYRTLAFALGESAYPETGVVLLRLWIDNKLRYDVTPTSQIAEESAEFANEFTFYPGDEEQEPDPDLEAMPVENGGGAGNVPSYRGGCPYIVFPEWDVTDSGGRAPMVLAELASSAAVLQSEVYVTGARDVGATAYRFQASPDGVDFSTTLHPTNDNNTRLVASPTRVLMYNAVGMSYTDDGGANFTSVVDFPGSSGGGYTGVWLQDMFWIPLGNLGYATSENGIDWDESATYAGAANYVIVGNDDVVILAGLNTGAGDGVNTRYSTNGGISWSANFSGLKRVGSSQGASTICGDAADGIIVVGGYTHALAWTANGSTFTQIPSPFVNGTGGVGTQVVGSIAAGYDEEGVRLWVATSAENEGGTLGQTAYSRTGTSGWTLIPGPLGFNIKQMIYANRGFIAIGDSGLIKRLTNVDDGWQDVSSSWTTDFNLRAVAYQPVPPITDSASVALSTIAQWIHARVELPSSKYDVSALTDEVEGVVFADGYTGASAMQAFMPLYHFDAGEFDAGSGYRINYVKRGAAAAMTLTEADIVEGPEDWEREDSYERPKVLHVAYQNPVADYGAPNIVIKRTTPDVLVVGERSASVPVVYSDVDEITRRADIMMTVIYTEIAGTYELILPWSLLELAPTDVIGFSIRGRVRRLRIDQWRFSPEGTIKCELWADRQSAYTSNVTGLPAVPSTPPPPSIVGPTVSAVLDIPALTDDLDSLHLIVAASGQTPAWYGANHQRKLPSDPDYSSGPTFSGVTTIMGLLQADVADASPHFTDTTNVVTVSLYGADDELQTFTQDQFLSENGAFALAWDDSGTTRWEVMQYRDAVKVGENIWELTTLLRGRLDTETAAHPADSLFVLLDAGIRAMSMTTAMLDQEVTHRAVSFGQLPDQATPYTEEYTGQSQTEWPVAHLFASLDGDTLDAEWVPRHRFGTDVHPVRSVNWTGYRVTATDGVNTASADTTSASHSFDVTGWSTPITVSVSQLNRFTGEGPAVSEEVA